MNLKKGIPVMIGSSLGYVFGGPFKQYVPGTRRLLSIKMAVEIDHPHDVSVPTEDFSVPSVDDMNAGLIRAVDAILSGNDVYVGCMGGIGRTGLFMGCMAKVLQDYANTPGTESTLHISDPVAWVRANYVSHAIETSEQKDFVRTFDTSLVLRHILVATSPKVVTKDVPYYPPLFDYLAHWFKRVF